MLTYQDFETATDLPGFIAKAITEHIQSEEYKTAVDADEYDHQRNVTVNNYTQFVAEHAGGHAMSANNRISSNYFHRLNVQRCTYLLGNGVSFTDHIREETDENGEVTFIDETKESLGKRFDRDFYQLAYYALIHRECFGFWNVDRLFVFPLTQFKPLYDEDTGALRAGIRFWRIADNKPMTAVLFAEDGYTKYRSRSTTGFDFVEVEPKRAYITKGVRTDAEGFTVTGFENYSTLPVIRMKGSELYQSTLVGMRAYIDAHDLIFSGFANTLQDCAEIFWIIENCGGMTDDDLREFLRKLNRDHIATADTKGMGVESSSLKPYVQEVPFESNMACLERIDKEIYEGFGALDVTTISAGVKTATEIDAAYQPLDEAADDFETQCTDFLQQLLALLGIEDNPKYKRNRICNQLEQTQMVAMVAQYLDDRAVLEHLPWITVDEVADIMARKDLEDAERAEDETPEEKPEKEPEEVPEAV